MTATVVLVHGGFVDASGWRAVYQQLRGNGTDVRMTQHSTRSLGDDVAAVHDVLDAIDGPVVLVGHSYGGAVITEAGNHASVHALVYVTAFAPDIGESTNSLIAGFPADGPQPPILPPVNGYLHLDREQFVASFAGDADPSEAEFMRDSQLPWGIDAVGATITNAAWRVKPSWYLHVLDDHMIPPAEQLKMAERTGATITSVRGSHAIYVSNPRVVADLIHFALTAVG